jgi:phosphoribosylaminoimidazole synthetase
MSILVVGSVALDDVETPFGQVRGALGGSAVHFSAAASLFTPVQVVGVVGSDYPLDRLDFLRARGVDLSGISTVEGESFRWGGRYTHDLATAHTLETRLGVFADFHPEIPDAFRAPEILFLGNIDPRLQLEVLNQVERPRIVACDTMNYWIEGSRAALLDVLARVDILLVNEGEARQLAGDSNLFRACRWILSKGPRRLVVKKGEHGAILFDEDGVFFVPGYPLEDVFDPTGAGDSFAGGFLGYLAGNGPVTPRTLRNALVHGSVLGSFAVEDFSVGRLSRVTRDEIAERARAFRAMTRFELTPGEDPDAIPRARVLPPSVSRMDYRSAGVDLDQAERDKEGLKALLRATRDEYTLSELGLFGGLYAVPPGVQDPVLVSSADGVGTKLKVAFDLGVHDTVGQCLVNHCVNDILVQGARPLFFLDYLATGTLEDGVVPGIVRGVAIACAENRCALVGGETAQMPDFYGPGEYDLAGFIVGLVSRDRILDGSHLAPGDQLIALPSSGLHTNGYTLARKILFDRAGLTVHDPFPGEFTADGTPVSVGDVLLRIHRSYLGAILPLLDRGSIRGMAHITGGGIPGNLPRIFQPGIGAVVRRDSWEIPNVFRTLQELGDVETGEMDRVFNMGVGMIVAVPAAEASAALELLRASGEPEAWILGEIEATETPGVRFV